MYIYYAHFMRDVIYSIIFIYLYTQRYIALILNEEMEIIEQNLNRYLNVKVRGTKIQFLISVERTTTI